jgi:carbonic anhydrase
MQGFGAATAGFAISGGASADPVTALPKPQNAVSPEQALKILMAGNARYVDGVSKRHDFKHEREALTLGQIPMLRY